MIKSILVAVDGSAYSAAARDLAARVAGLYDARVTGLHVVDVRLIQMPPFMTGAYPVDTAAASPLPVEVLESFRTNADSIMDDFRDTLSERGVEPELRIEEGVPADVIADVGNAYDLLIAGKRGAHAEYSEDLVGSTAEQVVRKTGSPVLLAEREVLELEDILLLYDGSRPATNALKLAADLATNAKAALRVQTVGRSLDEAGEIQEDARAYLEAYEIETDFRVMEGELVFEALDELEGEPADLVVLGKHGHSFLHDLILGSTTEQILRRARVSLLLAP